MGLEVAGEILLVGDGLAHEGFLHHYGVHNKVAQEHAQGKDHHCGVRGHLAGCGSCKIVQIHAVVYQCGEEGHNDTGQQRQDNALAVGGAVALFCGNLTGCDAVADDCQHNQRNTNPKQGGVLAGGGVEQKVVQHAHNQRDAHAQREGNRHTCK